MRSAPVAMLVTGLLVSSLGAQTMEPQVYRPPTGVVVTSADYTLIGWNDLGMHCISPRFAEFCILPPYNTLRAVVIRRGGEPYVVSSGIKLAYSIDNNQSVKNKTDFWTYAPRLFGTNLAPGVGLTGNPLCGTMAPSKLGGFEATGVPVLPYNDQRVWNPYQRATITLSIGKGAPRNITSVVVPVSQEMNCLKCHKSGGIAAKNLNQPTMEGNILTLHDSKFKTKLMQARPVLCASCHSDNALGAPGKRGVSSMSYAMHNQHASVAAASQPACFDCHPGAVTQCNRSKIQEMGPVKGDPKCDNCHGDLQKMAASLRAGRQPWLEEPTCAQCHGSKYSTGRLLYRNATGHGGIPCIACHNSPHAWWPSRRAEDNVQPLALQGNALAIGYKKCTLCHTSGQSGTVPPHEGEALGN